MTTRSSAVPETRAGRSRKVRRSLVGALLFALLATPSPAAPAPASGDPLALPLSVTNTGHLVVRGTVNGHAVRLVVDTACPVTIIDSAAYPKLTQSGAGSSNVGRTFYPKSLQYRAAASGSVAELRIGGTVLNRVPVGITALDTVLGTGGKADADGILGSDLLLRCGAILDLKKGSLVLKPDAGEKEALAQRVAREGYTSVPMTSADGFHAVPCVLSNVPCWLVVDTGSPGTVVQRGVLNSSELVRPSRVSYMKTLGGSTTVAWIPLQNWSVGDFPVASAMVATGNFRGGIYAERTSNGGQVEGQLGLEQLAHWRTLVDFSARKIYLRNTDTRGMLTRNTALTQRLTNGAAIIPNVSSLPAGAKGGKSR